MRWREGGGKKARDAFKVTFVFVRKKIKQRKYYLYISLVNICPLPSQMRERNAITTSSSWHGIHQRKARARPPTRRGSIVCHRYCCCRSSIIITGQFSPAADKSNVIDQLFRRRGVKALLSSRLSSRVQFHIKLKSK